MQGGLGRRRGINRSAATPFAIFLTARSGRKHQPNARCAKHASPKAQAEQQRTRDAAVAAEAPEELDKAPAITEASTGAARRLGGELAVHVLRQDGANVVRRGGKKTKLTIGCSGRASSRRQQYVLEPVEDKTRSRPSGPAVRSRGAARWRHDNSSRSADEDHDGAPRGSEASAVAVLRRGWWRGAAAAATASQLLASPASWGSWVWRGISDLDRRPR